MERIGEMEKVKETRNHGDLAMGGTIQRL